MSNDKLDVALHTGVLTEDDKNMPAVGADQGINEATYPGYKRQPYVDGLITFAEATGGHEYLTYITFGKDGKVVKSMRLSPPISTAHSSAPIILGSDHNA
jgi:hypothetical protein